MAKPSTAVDRRQVEDPGRNYGEEAPRSIADTILVVAFNLPQVPRAIPAHLETRGESLLRQR